MTRLLITGTGRTGTWWITHALRAHGIEADHEIAFSTRRHGDGNWQCEVSWLAAPFTPVADAHTVHLVRHPLDTIRSRAAWGSFEQHRPAGGYDPRIKGRWAIDQVPEIAAGADPIERAAIHWTRWNQLVHADEVAHIEHLTADDVTRLAHIVTPTATTPARLPRPGVNRSRSPIPRPTWADVAHIDGLLELADRYGYR